MGGRPWTCVILSHLSEISIAKIDSETQGPHLKPCFEADHEIYIPLLQTIQQPLLL